MASSQHIVMLPFMAQGHLIPFLALANQITQTHPSITITLVNTPLNIQTLQSSLPPNPNIHLKSLPFQSSKHSLPPHSENTDSLPDNYIVPLMLASESLEPNFDHLISDIIREEGRRPIAIIADVFFGWTVAIAERRSIFHATFTSSGAYGTAAYISLWLHLPHKLIDAEEFHIPYFPKTFRLCRSQLPHYMRSADGTEPRSVFLRKHILLSLKSNAMLCNTVQEAEPIGVELLRNITGLKVWTIGPLVPLDDKPCSYRRGGRKPGIELDDCIAWLDAKPIASVIYISFGSQNTIFSLQMMALAMGLEESNKPFIWVIRPPIGFDVDKEFREEWLPEGFEVRMKENKQGLLVKNWAPQLEILSHKSVGAFLSHCGWNSVLESLSRGVPIIGWPLVSEQFYNSKMLVEELGVGVEIGRGVECEIGSRDVERVVKLVMDGEKGKEMKAKAVRCSEMMKAAMERGEGEQRGSSMKAIDEFLESAKLETCQVKYSATSSGVQEVTMSTPCS